MLSVGSVEGVVSTSSIVNVDSGDRSEDVVNEGNGEW